MSTQQTAILEGDWLVLPMPKSTICVVKRADILRHLPQDLLLDGFRRGKRLRRRLLLSKRQAGGEA